MNLQLVTNANQWLKMYSNQVFLFISVMGVIQMVYPFVSWAFPGWMLGVITLLIGAAGIAARLLKQFNIDPETPAP